MKRLFINTLLITLISMTTSSVWAEKRISITGCGISKKAYLKAALTAFEEKTGVKSQLSGGGATKGLQLAHAGRVDLGASCRQRLSDVGGNIHEKETDIRLIHVGWDAIVVIANKVQKVDNISTEQLKSVFSGKLSNWKPLGGDNVRISVLTRKGVTSGVGYMARLLVFGDPNYTFSYTGKMYRSTGPLEKAVNHIEGALAFDGISSAKKSDIKMLAIDGYEPTKEHISAGDYPFFRPLYLAINKNNKTDYVKDFVDFILSDEGQKIISDEGTVNLKEGTALKDKWNTKAAAMGGIWQDSI